MMNHVCENVLFPFGIWLVLLSRGTIRYPRYEVASLLGTLIIMRLPNYEAT
jgi:hypothetical protein